MQLWSWLAFYKENFYARSIGRFLIKILVFVYESMQTYDLQTIFLKLRWVAPLGVPLSL